MESRRSRAAPLRALLALMVLAGCGGAAPLTSSTPGTTVAPAASALPSPEAVLPFPSRAAARLEHARYSSAPPFDLAFTFRTPGEGWESLHLLGEFLDVVRFDGESRTGPPRRSIAFGHPTRIWGREPVPAAGMTAADVAAALGGRDDLVASDPEPFELDGMAGLRVDLQVEAVGTSIFGGPNGNLIMEPRRDARLGIVPVGDELLLVIVSAVPGEVEDAWEQARPLLESVDLQVPAATPVP